MVSDSTKACQECGHENYVHVNWVGSCAVYIKGKRCPCGVYRNTRPTFTGPTYSIRREVFDTSTPERTDSKTSSGAENPNTEDSKPCPTCDDRQCMDCVMRYHHDRCENTCPRCGDVR